MKKLITISRLLLLVCITINSAYSQNTKKTIAPTLKTMTDSNHRIYVIQNGKIMSESGDGSVTYKYNLAGLLESANKYVGYTYNTDGTLKAVIKNPQTINTTISMFTYTANNINEKEYSGANLNLAKPTNEFNYALQNGLIVSKTKVGSNDLNTYKYDSLGNMIYYKSEIIRPNGKILFRESTYTYDTHPSVENLINRGYFGNNLKWTYVLLGSSQLMLANNCLTITYSSNYNSTNVIKTSTTTRTYTYAQNGYPASVSQGTGGNIITTYYGY